MHFWIINAQENPAEPRHVAKRREWRSNTLSEALADRGHEVVRWRSAFSHNTKTYLSKGSQKIAHDNYFHQFIDGPAYKRHVGLARIRHHRALGDNFEKIAANYTVKPDLIHVGDVPIALAGAAVAFGKQHQVPVVIDIRDLWPDVYVDLIPQQIRALRGPALRLLRAGASGLKVALRDATAISALTPSYLDWALQLAGRKANEDDVVFEMCFPIQTAMPSEDDMAALRARLGLCSKHTIACYAGTIGHQVDVGTLVAAARMLKDQLPSFRMVIAGKGPALNDLKVSSSDLDNVILPGWLGATELSCLMSISSIGLIAYPPVPNFLRSISNKFPEYLANGLAIMCGLQGEMGRLVDQHRCGLLYDAANADMLATRLTQLVNDPDGLSGMQTRARELHRDRFDGAQIYPRFADYLEEMAKNHSSPTLAP